MLAFLIYALASIFFFILGIAARLSRKPARFWNIRHEIKVRDVSQYNRAVSLLFIIGAFILLPLGLPLLAGQNSPLVVLTVLGTMFWSIGIMAAYTKIERKYRIYP